MSMNSKSQAVEIPPGDSHPHPRSVRHPRARAGPIRAVAFLALTLVCPSSPPARAGSINSRPATLVEVRRDGVRIIDPQDAEGRWGTRMDVVFIDRDSVELSTEFDDELVVLQLRAED